MLVSTGLLGSGRLYWALVGRVGLSYAARGSTTLRLRNVHVKLLPVNTKLLSMDTVAISKYKQVQCCQEPGTAY